MFGEGVNVILVGKFYVFRFDKIKGLVDGLLVV